ncbi:Uncharacterised protein [Mycobacterium tuberculosis]|nr:Uncharacterised protein [Mycobacterium tuberculosis]
MARAYEVSRNRVRSIIGFDDLRSSQTNRAQPTAAVQSITMVWTDVQPIWGPSMTAYTRAPTATMNSSCPDRSKRRARSLHDSST